MLQHGAYTLLIDSCYDREEFPTLEEAIEWTWASTEAEIEAVKFVLSRFFKLGNDGKYVQDRILSELLDYHAKADKNKRIALDRETKRREKSTNRAPIVNEAPPNQEPITINQEPITKNQEPRTKREKKGASASVVQRPDFVDEQLWNDWLVIRKKKNAPLTQTAWDLMTNEAAKAGWPIDKAIEECCLRTWASFKADWVATQRGQVINKQAAVEHRNQVAVDEWMAQQGATHESN